MELIEAKALKSSSFFSEAEMKPANPQSLVDDFWYAAAAATAAVGRINGGFSSGDEFSVDDYFDLSAVEGLKEGGFQEEEEVKLSSSSSSSSSLSVSFQDQIDESSSFSAGFNTGSAVSGSPFAAAELAIPVDDMKELEIWSHLMDDTVTDGFIGYPAGLSPFTHVLSPWNRLPVKPDTKPVQLEAAKVPAKQPRSKRVRKPGLAWRFSAHLKLESSSSSISTSPEEESSFLFMPNPVQETGESPGAVRKPAKKKQKRKPALEPRGSPAGPVQLRRCTHCQVQRTPQWRTGPLGPRTLCNACGVRFKSGRLFPEYRPACSPTFLSEIHSNSHRKVLEIRKKKGASAVVGLAPATMILHC